MYLVLTKIDFYFFYIKYITTAKEAAVGVQIADSLHPVASPAVDREGNVFSTFSGTRGQRAPVSIYKVDTNYTSKPFVSDLMNPTGLAFDRDGLLYASNRFDGIVYQITPTGNMSVFVEGMGVATGYGSRCAGPAERGRRWPAA